MGLKYREMVRHTCQDNRCLTTPAAAPSEAAESQEVGIRQNPESTWNTGGPELDNCNLQGLAIFRCCQMSLSRGGEMGRGTPCWLEQRPEIPFLCPKALWTSQSGGFTFHSVSIPQVLMEVSLCSTSLSGQALVTTDKHVCG
ncbi:hypothetical protein VULLAG_LOCUS266 [Vulpes lagopus]